MTIIANRYRLLSELGQGAMGTVYKAIDTLTNTTVAIKHLTPKLITPEHIERFKQEGEALRELNHPNIVKMLDALEYDGAYYLVMEYVSGGDLYDLLLAGQLSIEHCLGLALDLADALTRTHKLDIIHLDLKPANVLLAADGTLRLTDFGLARIGQRERVLATDKIVGTVEYLAPEALDGTGIDWRADIWAFGVMLFEMLTGMSPFRGASVNHTLYAILTEPVPDLETLRPDAPLALTDLIYRMLEKDPQARIGSVRYIGAELEDILQGRAGKPQPSSQNNRFATSIPDFLHRPKHNLPAQTTPFVGREVELAELAKLLGDSNIRLITILAQGGMGKTRLALEVARQRLTYFENGVYFIELAPIADPVNIVAAIADATGYQFQGDGRNPKQQILDFLSKKDILLVLDNYEHLLEGASLVTDILKAAPQVKILATSRQRLNQSSETLFKLGGMDFPAWETPADALEYAAVKLFLQSAKRAKPDFDVTTDNMRGIARICQLVQGMPLGIMLAASWLSMLSPDEIATEILQNIDFLENALSDLPERHHSIRAVFDYSWDLLTDAEQQVFMKLWVFRGGFTRDAADAVAGANLRILMSLMNKSLIRRDADTGRYTIHELLRQYGEAKASTSDETSILKEKHAFFFIQPLIKLAVTPFALADSELLREVDNDFENVRAAWRFYIDNKQLSLLRQGMIGLWTYLSQYSRSHEGFELFEPILEKFSDHQTGAALELQGLTLALVGLFNSDVGFKTKALELLHRADVILQQFDETEALLVVYLGQGIVNRMIGNDNEDRSVWRRGVALAQKLGLVNWEGLFTPNLAEDYARQGDFETALRVLDTTVQRGYTLLKKGALLSQLGDYNQAEIYLLKSLTKEPHHRASTVEKCGRLVECAVVQNNYEQAQTYFRRGLQVTDNASYIWLTILILYYGLSFLVAKKYYIMAIEIVSLLLHHPQTMGRLLKPVKRYEETLKTYVSTDEYTLAYQRGQALDLETVVQRLLDEFGEKAS